MSSPAVFLPPRECDRPYTISEINQGIATVIESGNTLIWIEGELSNWKPSSSGHCYFRLKDETSQIPAVLWKSAAQELEWKPADGMAVMAIASIRVYQRGGYYQLDVHKMQPLGQGALHAAFLRLKERLEREGLFDVSFKQPLSDSVKRIGVVTSLRGAALHDIVRVTASRAPQTDLIIRDVAVQGDGAAKQIAAAIEAFNRAGSVDCIIVGRGGGSLEDLWAFNEEVVARAIFASKIPVISAVGHEIDYTISDFTADIRAATPSAAAEIAVADTRDAARLFATFTDRFKTASARYFTSIHREYLRLLGQRSLRAPVRLLSEAEQYRDELQQRLEEAVYRHLEKRTATLASAAKQLDALSPLSVLARGYSVVSDASGRVVHSAGRLHEGDKIDIRFSEGSAAAVIGECREKE